MEGRAIAPLSSEDMLGRKDWLHVTLAPVRLWRDKTMSQVVTLELSDEVCTALKQKAERAGISLSEWIQITLDQQSGLPSQQRTEAENEAARQRFRKHAGAIDLGYPTGEDTDLIAAYSGDKG
jgi:hypothetical protein